MRYPIPSCVEILRSALAFKLVGNRVISVNLSHLRLKNFENWQIFGTTGGLVIRTLLSLVHLCISLLIIHLINLILWLTAQQSATKIFAKRLHRFPVRAIRSRCHNIMFLRPARLLRRTQQFSAVGVLSIDWCRYSTPVFCNDFWTVSHWL